MAWPVTRNDRVGKAGRWRVSDSLDHVVGQANYCRWSSRVVSNLVRGHTVAKAGSVGARRRIDDLNDFFGICCTIIDLAPSHEVARWCGVLPCDTATGTVACVPGDAVNMAALKEHTSALRGDVKRSVHKDSTAPEPADSGPAFAGPPRGVQPRVRAPTGSRD